MNTKQSGAWMFVFILMFLPLAGARLQANPRSTEVNTGQLKTSEVQLISAEELKAKVAKKEPVTIIDVRAASSYADSDTKIKGAIHVKLRKLKYRLGFLPLKNVPRDREVVTYCACPSEETSILAAQVLLDSGFKRVRALKGGWQEWLKASGQLESKPRGL